jgi:two-component system, NarL family, sensor kinase
MSRREDPAELAEIAGRVARIAAENSRLVQRFAHHEQRFRRLSRGVLRAQEAERRRISRELHDGVGQALTALKIQLDLLAQTSDGGAPELDDVRRLAAAALDDVRELSRLLRPHMLDDVGLLPTLQWHFRGVEKATGMRVEFVHEGLDRRLDPDAETLAYRIVQEAVTNSVRHAQARRIAIDIRHEDGLLVLRIRDDGRGLGGDWKAPGHYGLVGMHERASAIGGTLSIESPPGEGLSVVARLPTAGDEAAASRHPQQRAEAPAGKPLASIATQGSP